MASHHALARSTRRLVSRLTERRSLITREASKSQVNDHVLWRPADHRAPEMLRDLCDGYRWGPWAGSDR
jgi:hypothetical protein